MVQSDQSAPGQLAAAIAKADPRSRYANQVAPQPSPEQTAETLGKLLGQDSDGSETADRPG